MPFATGTCQGGGVNEFRCAAVSVNLPPQNPAFIQAKQLFRQELHWNKFSFKKSFNSEYEFTLHLVN